MMSRPVEYLIPTFEHALQMLMPLFITCETRPERYSSVGFLYRDLLDRINFDVCFTYRLLGLIFGYLYFFLDF